MKKFKYIQYIALAGLILTAASCKKFLEQAPDSRAQINSKEKVAQLLTSGYPKAEYLSFTEFYSDNVEDKGVRADYRYSNVGDKGPAWDQFYLWEDVENGESIEGSPDNYWNETYLAIASANTALKYINEHPNQADLRPYKAEALLCRAYAHFMLVTLFSKVYKPGAANDSPGIPFVTDPEVTVSPQYTRGTVEEVYSKIEKDLTDALPLVDNTVYKVAPKYHFSLNSANAFAARFYLFKGDFSKVIEYSNKVMADMVTTKSLLRPWNTTYLPLVADAFSILFTQSSQNDNLLMGEASSLWGRNQSIRYGLGRTVSNNVMFGPNVSGGEYAYRANPYIEPFWSNVKFKELFFESKIGSGTGTPYIMVPLLTADELIMNRAEAYASGNQFNLALDDINTFLSTRIKSYNVGSNTVTLAKVATFTGLQDPKAGLIKTILDLKRAEFISEGLRWFDIIRHDLSVKHNKLDANGNQTFIELKAGDPRRVFQLPKPTSKAGLAPNPR